MKFSGLQRDAKSDSPFDPLLIWDRQIENATGLGFESDIKNVFEILEQRVKA